MNAENELKENKMGVMPVGRLLLNMSAPLVASMLFQALYNIVDSIFVARLGQDAMNAVSLAFPVQSLSIALSSGTAVGMNAMISRSLGAGDKKRVDLSANTGIFLLFCSAVVMCLFGIIGSRTFYEIQTSNSVIVDYGTSYLMVCIGCSFPLFAQICSERLLQSTGRTDLSMIPQITGAVINMILDPIMIFGLLGFPRLEVLGAAVATVIGQTIAAILGFCLNATKNKEITIRFSLIRFHKSTALEIYRIALPSIIMQGIGSLINLSLNKILIGFTEAATAVFGAYYKVQSFIFMPVFGMNNAVIPIVSYNYGARNNARMKATIRKSIVAAVTIMIIGCAVFELFPELLIGIFSPTEEMREIAGYALRIIGIHFPFAGFSIVAGAVCQALGRPAYSMITSVCRQVIVLLPAAYLLSLTGILNAVWLAFPIAEIMSFILSFVFLRITLKRVETELEK